MTVTKPSPETPKTSELSTEFIEEIKSLRGKRKLHAHVESALLETVKELFPEWVCIAEIGQTPGGRNDAVLFECAGDSICFELFGSRSQVDRDLLLLFQSPAKRKIAILIDREIDPTIADAYYRKRPHAPFPSIWVSDLLLDGRRSTLKSKLEQYVMEERGVPLSGTLTAPTPDVRIEVNAGFTQSAYGGTRYLLAICVQNHSPVSVYLSGGIFIETQSGGIVVPNGDFITGEYQRFREISPGRSYTLNVDPMEIRKYRSQGLLCAAAKDDVGRVYRSSEAELTRAIRILFGYYLKEDIVGEPDIATHSHG
jgi:hypothetical protein